MDQAIDAAVQADEHAEVGDRLDRAGDLVALLVDRGERFPRIGARLLHAERDAAALFVDVQNHDLDFIADLHDLGRIDVLVGPVHFRNVDETLDAGLELDEAAVVGDVGNLAEQARAGRVTTGDRDPRILAELLESERNAIALAVELQHADIELVADVDHFGRMTNALPRHVGDVQEAIDAAEVDERTVVGEVLDDALDDRAFLQTLEQLFALLGELALDHRATRDHHVVALAVELDDLELELFAFEIGRDRAPGARRRGSPAGMRGRP